MAVSEQSTDYQFDEEEDYSECGESELEDYTDKDPSYSILEETDAMFSNLSIKKNKSEARMFEDVDTGSGGDSDELEVVVPELDEKDVQSFDRVQKIIEAGQLEKLKVDQCKVYLRKNGLRLTGTKDKLIQRIREHLEILNGGGEMKYPVSSFVLNCKGDACTGDVVMFEQNVYEMFNIASRSAGGPPSGTRTVVGRIVKESYGAAKQQHTFTIEVLWSKGDKPLPPLHPLLIKGRNLYRLKTLRQTWEDERERQKVMMEKHLRGSTARCDREARLQEKETRKMLKATRISRKESNRNQSQFNSTSTAKSVVQLPQAGLQECKRMQTQQAGLSFEPRQRMTHPQQQNNAIQSNHHLQQPSQNFTESRRAGCTERISNYSQGVHRAYYKPPNFCSNDSQASIRSIYPDMNGANVLSERTHHRQPLTTINHFAPGSQPHRQGHTRQLCRYYSQGRCYYGDNCKFVHNSRRS